MMSAADGGDVILTCGFVKQVVDGDLSNESFTGAIVQVLEISWLLSNNGRNRCSVTVSDGEHLMECFLAPSFHSLVRSEALKKYTVVSVGYVISSCISDRISFILNDVVVVQDLDDVIQEPILYEKVVRGVLSDSSNQLNSIASISTRRKFQAQHEHYCSANRKEDEVGREQTGDSFVLCENCHNKPCLWVQYGPGIVDHLSNDYVGRYVDSDGNLVDEPNETCTIITNKQLRFLAYSAYTAAKYGYLGKRKRIPIPRCVEYGIRCNYPDDHEMYIGFKEASEE